MASTIRMISRFASKATPTSSSKFLAGTSSRRALTTLAVRATQSSPVGRLQERRQPATQGSGFVVVSPTPRWYSTESSGGASGGSKMWTFDEISALVSSASTDSQVTTTLLVDVREPGELASTGRIPGSVNIPVSSSPDALHLNPEDFEDRFGFAKPDPSPKGPELIFYCKAGVRSRAAAGLARDAGFQRVGEYPGSWVDWAGKGGKVER